MSFEIPADLDDPPLVESGDTGTWKDPELVRAVMEMKKRMGLAEHTDESEP